MSTFVTDIEIKAPLEAVWQALADIGTIATWNPGVKDSYTTSAQTEGVGACRYCDLGNKMYLDEEVVKWEVNRFLTMRITKTNLPFKRADIRFTLQSNNGGTRVTVSPDYELKYGPLGTLLDKIYIRKNYEQGMQALLAGLKKHVEQAQ